MSEMKISFVLFLFRIRTNLSQSPMVTKVMKKAFIYASFFKLLVETMLLVETLNF